MRPKKYTPEEEEERWRRKHPEPPPTPFKVREYKVVFKDSPVEHRVIITFKDEWYTGQTIFSKPLLNPVGVMSRGDLIQSRKLDDVKAGIRSFLKLFGEYTITPL